MAKEAYLIIDNHITTDLISLHLNLDDAKQEVLKTGRDSREIVVFRNGKPAEWITYKEVYKEYRQNNPRKGKPIEIEITPDEFDEEKPEVIGKATLPDGTILPVELRETNWYYLEKHGVDVVYGIYLRDDSKDSRVEAYVSEEGDYTKYLRKPELLRSAESYVAIEEYVTEDYYAVVK